MNSRLVQYKEWSGRRGWGVTTHRKLLKWVSWFITFMDGNHIPHPHLQWRLNDGSASLMRSRRLVSNTNRTADMSPCTYQMRINNLTETNLGSSPHVVKPTYGLKNMEISILEGKGSQAHFGLLWQILNPTMANHTFISNWLKCFVSLTYLYTA